MRTPGAARSTLGSSDWPRQHVSAMPGVHGGRRRSVRWLAWLLHGKPTGREGKRRRAHGGASGGDDEVGEALDAPNRWSRSPGTGGEDDDAPVGWGLFWSRASSVLLHGVVAELGYAERERGSGCGCGGCERRRRRLSVGRTEEGEERRRVRERGREVRGTTREGQGVEGERQAGGGRGACARTAATRPPAHWQEVEDDREEPLVGWAGFARLGCYSARPGGLC